MDNQALARKIFEALDVDKIVWLDDEFSNPNKDELLEANQLHQAAMYKIDIRDVSHLVKCELLDKKFSEAPKNVQRQEVEKHLASGFFDHKKAALYLLGEAAAESEYDAGEMVRHQFNAIIEFLRGVVGSVKSISFKEWLESREEADHGPNTLMLVDLNAKKEGMDELFGENVLEHYASSLDEESRPSFVVLTHEVRTPDEEERSHGEIKSRLNERRFDVGPDYFQVMAKSRLSEKDDIVRELLINLRRLLSRKVSFSLAKVVSRGLVSAIESAKEEMFDQGIYAIEKALFDASRKEGASEVETFFRLVNLAQTRSIYTTVGENGALVDRVAALRSLKLAVDDPDSEKGDPSMSFFHSLRRSEVFVEADYINSVCDPLSPGDIFTFTQGDNSQDFVLISQPCDMVLRTETGLRKADVGILLPIKTKQNTRSKQKDLEKAMYHQVFVDRHENKIYYVELNGDYHVNLNVLDWCSFNENGSTYFSRCIDKPRLVFLEGHAKKFDLIYSAAQSFEIEADFLDQDFPTLFSFDHGLSSNGEFGFPTLVDVNQSADDVTFSVPLVRSGRLKGLHFDHLLRAYFSYRARQAFDHDFTRPL